MLALPPRRFHSNLVLIILVKEMDDSPELYLFHLCRATVDKLVLNKYSSLLS